MYVYSTSIFPVSGVMSGGGLRNGSHRKHRRLFKLEKLRHQPQQPVRGGLEGYEHSVDPKRS